MNLYLMNKEFIRNLSAHKDAIEHTVLNVFINI